MLRVELALPVEDGVVSFACWTLRAVSLGAVPSVVWVGADAASCLVAAVYLLMPVPIAIIA